MPGCIVGVVGKQRSGKTLIAYKLAKEIYRAYLQEGKYIPVYTNLWCPEDDFRYINSISDIPLNLDPKIILIDEIYNGLDAQDYKKLKDVSIFVNTIGKQNCFFIFTTIKASMVYNRVREQMNCCVLVKGDAHRIYYKFVSLDNMMERSFVVEKNEALFRDVNYDTNFIPPVFDWGMDDWNVKLRSYWSRYYSLG